MAIDGKILGAAKRELASKRMEHEAEIERRTAEVYAKSPRIKEIDAQISTLVAELIGTAFEPASQGRRAVEMTAKRNALRDERRSELVKAGFREDYLDFEPMCPLCNDTGFLGTKMCDCLKSLYSAAQRASLSSLLKMGNETFDSFKLTYYDDTPSADTGISPRKYMEIVFETCVRYADRFGKNSMNLFLNGAPGLGKTFLSACIARVVADNGYSVVYDVAGSIFTKYEDLKFSKVEDLDEPRDDIRRYLECDLLIIDDLGTEMTTQQTIAALYDIINTRLITSRKTIVNSNLTMDEMHERYSMQIMSRLEGEYQVLTFFGEDIRKKRNMEV